ncbi:MAG: hypothetical protein ACRELD_04760 [Longimicrobiales bacterium]
MPGPNIPQSVLIRDLFIFQLKLWLDGLKDLVLAPISIGALVLDILAGRGLNGYRLYNVLRAGERFDRWLSLYSAAKAAPASAEGLFGASRAGDATLLGRLEEMTGSDHDEPGPAPESRSRNA